MLQHAQRRAAQPLSAILQAAASRAWMRTRPVRVRTYHRTSTANQGDLAVAHVDESYHSDPLDVAGPSRFSQLIALGSRPSQNTQAVVFDAEMRAVHDDVVEKVLRSEDTESVEAENTLRAAPAKPTNRERIIRDPTRRKKGLQHIRVRKLSEADISFVDPGLSPSLPYQDDPPWPEISSSLASSGIRLTTVFTRDVNPDYSDFIPVCKESLHRILLSLITPAFVPPLSVLTRYHDAYPQYQSKVSFNFLISLSMQQNDLGTAKQLLVQMASCGFSGNTETRKLRVRLLIRLGHWLHAWKMETVHGPLPLPVWLEFALGQREASLRLFLQQRKFARVGIPMNVPTQPTDRERARLLLLNFPVMNAQELAKIPPHTMFVLVRWMIQSDKRKDARRATQHFFESLPQRLGPRIHRICLDIIHLHLLPHHPDGLFEPHIACKTLNGMLAVHRDLRPTATTLFYLLRTIRHTKHRTSHALRLVREFSKRWGPGVVDDRVLRRIASFALSERKLKVVISMIHRHARLKEREDFYRAHWQDVHEVWTIVRKRPRRYTRRELFPRHGSENTKWHVIRWRLRRIAVKKIRAQKVHEEEQSCKASTLLVS